jgi:hypothetical protein
MANTTNSKISNLVASQVPFFVRNDHDTFVKFMEAYYEYTEQSGKVVERAKNLPAYSDIDRTVDEFTEYFYKTYLAKIPRNIMADKSLVLKHIKDFYTARGTEKSIQFLIRILLGDENVEFYYPKRDVLKASDGKWFVEKSLKIEDVHVNGVPNTSVNVIQNFKNRKISGNTSNAYAIVERAEVYYEGDVLIYELKISNQYKTFRAGETIYTLFDENGTTKSLTANLFKGFINTVEVTSPGTGYKIGDIVSIESLTGTGGNIIVSSVTSGNIVSLGIINGGAGFKIGDTFLITGGGGSGAGGFTTAVLTDNSVHPNSYSVPISTIALEANTPIGNTFYSNLSSSNANTTLANATSYFTYSNTGPISATTVSFQGSGYLGLPTITAVSNTVIRNLGILGRMEIVNGGLNYANGDIITFTNVIGGYGTGASANVKSVDANGKIAAVQFVQVPGQIIGGSGYSQSHLPIANVVSGTGNGASIIVSAVLGDGENIQAGTTSVGSIIRLLIVSRGTNYDVDTTLNLSSIGDGTAKATASIVTGSFTYPGRYLNDDGHLSGYNFLEDRDYYQSFSYVVKARHSIEKYRKALKDLIHPAGMRLFGEYLFVDPMVNVSFNTTNGQYANTTYTGTYTSTSNANGTLVLVYSPNIDVSALSNVYIEIMSGDTDNLSSGKFSVNTINSSAFTIYYANTMSGTVSANAGVGNTRILTGSSTPFGRFNLGDRIRISGHSNTFYVGAVKNATSLTVTTRLPKNITGNTFYRVQTRANSNGNILFTSI